jgi:hypothetical protein
MQQPNFHETMTFCDTRGIWLPVFCPWSSKDRAVWKYAVESRMLVIDACGEI